MMAFQPCHRMGRQSSDHLTLIHQGDDIKAADPPCGVHDGNFKPKDQQSHHDLSSFPVDWVLIPNQENCVSSAVHEF
jgi:hypothetical protein